jgi:hypothetical protein
MPRLRDSVACSAWSRHATTVKNDGWLSRLRPDTATWNVARAIPPRCAVARPSFVHATNVANEGSGVHLVILGTMGVWLGILPVLGRHDLGFHAAVLLQEVDQVGAVPELQRLVFRPFPSLRAEP